MKFPRIIVTALALVFLSSFAMPAAAGDTLSASEIERFVSSMSDVNVMAEELEKEGKNDVLKAKVDPVKGGDFEPYTRAVKALKEEFPADYTKLGKIVGNHGFSSQENWANTGNDVIKAYLATKMPPQAVESMKIAKAQMTPEMLASMPPEAKIKMETTMKMMEKIQAVPEANKTAIAPYANQIENLMGKGPQQDQE